MRLAISRQKIGMIAEERLKIRLSSVPLLTHLDQGLPATQENATSHSAKLSQHARRCSASPFHAWRLNAGGMLRRRAVQAHLGAGVTAGRRRPWPDLGSHCGSSPDDCPISHQTSLPLRLLPENPDADPCSLRTCAEPRRASVPPH